MKLKSLDYFMLHVEDNVKLYKGDEGFDKFTITIKPAFSKVSFSIVALKYKILENLYHKIDREQRKFV